MPSIQKQAYQVGHDNQKNGNAQARQNTKNSASAGNLAAASNQQQQNQTNKNQRINTNETNDKRVMTHEKVRRGDLYGPIFDVEHLATFTVGSKQGLLKAEDGMRKLRIMEKSHGIWTMECQLILDANYLAILDKKTGQEVELFPFSLVHDPTSVISDDKKDVYNNILLFTILEDAKKKSSSSAPSEMHIFQCVKTHSTEIVDEIYRIKEGSYGQVHPNSKQHISSSDTNDQLDNFNSKSNILANKITAANLAASAKLSPLNTRLHQNDPSLTPSKIELEVQILNHCFDDIERFVTRLQNSTEFFKELERRKKHRKSHKKSNGEGMLSLRAQMPPPQHFIDIFQKFKLSFNLLAKLKAHIHDPNAPELIHFLFTPLTLIFNTTKEQPYRGLSKTVWNPLLAKDAKELLLNCLTSREQDLWLLLGESWTVTSEEAKLQPQLYGIYDSQPFTPVFYDGWSTSINLDSNENNEMSRLAFATAAQVQAQSHLISNQPQLPIQKQRFYSNTQPQFDEPPLSGKQNQQQQQAPFKFHHNDQRQVMQGLINGQLSSDSTLQSKQINIPNYDKMKKWAIDLCYRGVKIFEVTHDRQANNDKELTIKTGELLEVLDDKKNWWRLRNFKGQIGHAPVTILRQFEFSSSDNNNNNLVGQFDPEKPFEFEQTASTNHKKISNLISHTANLQTDMSQSYASSLSSSSSSSRSNLANEMSKRNGTYNVFSPDLNYTNDYTNNERLIDSNTFLIDDKGQKNDKIKLSRHLLKEDKTISTIEDNSYEILPKSFNSANQNSYSSSSGHFSGSLQTYSFSTNKTNSYNNKPFETTPITPKSANSLKKDMVINSVNVIFDSAEDKIFQEKYKLVTKKFNQEMIPLSRIEPMKEILHEELVKRMSKEKIPFKDVKKSVSHITNNSNSNDVRNFLISKEFSQKVILMFGELNGAQLFTLNKSDFEKFCGKEEGTRLDSQITVQKSLCGYSDPVNELDNILRKRKEKSEI